MVYNGFNVIIMQNHENGDRVKTHKKKRIDKKWEKKYGYYNNMPLEKGKIIIFDNKMYMSKLTYNNIKKGIL